MALTSNQVKYKLTSSTSYTKASTSNNGDIIFYYHATNGTNVLGSRKIFARGQEWLGTDSHYGNSFKVYAGSTEVVDFNQQADKTLTFSGTSGVSVTSSASTITVSHSTAAGYKHVPTSGATNKYLMYSASGTAKWSDTTYGTSTIPIYINAGVPTQIGYTIQSNVPSNAVFTDTTYTLYVGASDATSNTSTTNPYINFRSSNSTNNQLRLLAGTNSGLEIKSDTQKNITISVDSTHTIPTSTQVTNWNTAYNWYNTNVAPTAADADTTINKWNEIITFLDGQSDTTTLSALLAGKADSDHGHNVVSSSANGFAPMTGTAASATIGTPSTEWVLTTTSGGTPTWRKLPANAFDNTTYTASYTVKVANTQRGRAYTPSQSAATDFVNGSATTTTKFTSSTANTTETASITVSGPSLIAANGTTGDATAFNSSVQADSMFWFDM